MSGGARRGIQTLGRRRLLLAAAAGVAGAAAHVGDRPALAAPAQPRGTLVAALAATPANLDSMSNTAIEVILPASHIYEQLFAWSKNFMPSPELAEGHTVSSDGRDWTVALRRGVKFHSGAEMTADDVLACIDRWRQVSSIGNSWTDVTIKRIDAYTIGISSKNARGTILDDLAQNTTALTIMPRDVAQGAAANQLKQYVGTGPFMFDSMVPDQYVRLRAFPGYVARHDPPDGLRGGKAALVSTLEFRIIKDVSTRVAALRAGEIDVVDNVPGPLRSTLAADSGVQMMVVKPYLWRGFTFNYTRPLPSNVLVRRAIQAGINGEEMALAAVGDPTLFRLDPGIAYRESFYYSDLGKDLYNQNNPAKAKQLLAQAGYKGEPVVVISTHDVLALDRLATMLKVQLGGLGMNVQLNFYDGATFRQVRTQKTMWDIIPIGWSTVFDPDTFKQAWYSTSGSWGWYNFPDLDRIFDAATRAVDLNTRKKIYAQLQLAVMEDIPDLKVYDEFGLRAARKRVKGLTSYIQMSLWNVSVEG